MNMLIGDTTGSDSVNSSDVGETKLQTGQVVSSSNFRDDVDATGDINSTDVSLVKLHSGEGVSAPPAKSKPAARPADKK